MVLTSKKMEGGGMDGTDLNNRERNETMFLREDIQIYDKRDEGDANQNLILVRMTAIK